MKKILALILLATSNAFAVDIIPNPAGQSTVGDPTNWFFAVYSTNYFGDGSQLTGVSATIPATSTNRFTLTNDTTWFIPQSTRVALTNGYLRSISVGDTNGYIRAISITDTNTFATTNNTTWFLLAANRVSLTNGFITVADFPTSLTNGYLRNIAITDTNYFTATSDVAWFIPQSTRVALTNGYIRSISVADTNGYLRAISTADTNGYIRSISTSDTNGYIRSIATTDTNQFMPMAVSGTSGFHYGNNPSGIEIAITNADPSSWSGFTAQSDKGSFVTNYFGIFINNSAFVPGSTYAGSTNDAVLEMAAGNFIVDMIGGNAHWYFITRPSTNGVMTTNWDLTATALNFKTQPQFNGANLITSIAVTDTNTYTATNDTRSLSLRAAANLFNGAFAGMGSGLTNLNWGSVTSAPAFLTTIAVTVTNQFIPTNTGSASLTIGGLVRATNGFSSTVSNTFPVTTFALTANTTNFFTNTFGRDIVVGFVGTTITGVGMTGTNAGVGGAFVQWATALTGGSVPLRINATASFTNGASAGAATWTPFP